MMPLYLHVLPQEIAHAGHDEQGEQQAQGEPQVGAPVTGLELIEGGG